MSERTAFRGSSRGHRGGGDRGDRGDRGSRGSYRGGRGGGAHNYEEKERPKKENILDLSKYIDKDINVKFNGGREIKGKLRGFDGLMNLVLDDVWETLQDEQGKPAKRFLGLLVARGTLLTIISPCDGSEEIQNPFAQEDDDD